MHPPYPRPGPISQDYPRPIENGRDNLGALPPRTGRRAPLGPFRFVHIADVHLDTVFAARSDDVRRRLREAAREAFRRAVDLTLRSGAHALLIAGDLFDQDRISFATERFLAEELARLRNRGISVCY